MLKTAHRFALMALALGYSCGGGFAADTPKYDHKIEAAVKQIVARKVGDIRGPYDIDAKSVKIVEFQGPVRPAIYAFATLPKKIELVEGIAANVAMSGASASAEIQVPVTFLALILITFDPSAPVQVAAIAPRKVRVLSSFLYY